MIAATFTLGDGLSIGAVVVLVALGGLLALAETGLVRMNKARARSLAEQGHRAARRLERLTDDPEGFLAPVLLIVLICQLVSATLVSLVASRLFGALGVVIGLVFEVVVIFVAAEAVPKNWAVRNADRAALLAAPLVSVLVAFPPIKALSAVLIGLARIVTPGGRGRGEPDVTESDLLAMADVAVEAEVIEHGERALLNSIIEFGDTIVREVMVPRPDIIAAEDSLSTGEVLEEAIAAGVSRIPVYADSVDDITGVVFTRDLVRAARSGDESSPVREVARQPRYVPETKRVSQLLREMQDEQFHLAVVVDEYGVTAGIVTLEDLIEELVGEIADEFDVEEPQVEVVSEAELLVPGQMAIDEVNELLDVDLPEGDWDTIAGLAFHLRGQLPREGDVIPAGGYDLVIERMQGRRIRRIRVVRREDALEPSERSVS